MDWAAGPAGGSTPPSDMWWRFQLKKRRAKREALMALAVHEENQSKKSQSKEKDKETVPNDSTREGMASQDIYSKTSKGGYRSVHFRTVKSVSEVQEVIAHSWNDLGTPQRTVVSWMKEETTSWSRVYGR
ncbi:uncharacterized protein LOC126267008 isoform X2 [Schistocerca gregaria]|uniref:uncharacterized protein LOC126267008 isoform X2 n=1 Tax=Schistocerca gregaria TaxID=7010 RepID=UPI00211F32BD|nr:uncharacterized protein LOC126267008 isoform X2 [Schistocerca gregaria]